jgi:transcriptional regulator with XRE-family HTH domain
MTTATLGQGPVFGRYMKLWRQQRGLSQLDLAIRADLSQRHVSFIETGRSRPGEDVVHRVSEALEVPLRDRNILLEAAGLAPSYAEVPLSDGAAAPFRGAIQKLLESHEPYPAYVINRWWELIDANEAGRRIFPQTGDGPMNLVDGILGPGPFREMIVNFPAVAWMFLRRMRREVAESGPDERLQELLARAEGYMKDVPLDDENPGADMVVCPHFRIGDQVIKTVAMVARFGTAREVTLDELRVELVFPRDDEAEEFFRLSAEAAGAPL